MKNIAICVLCFLLITAMLGCNKQTNQEANTTENQASQPTLDTTVIGTATQKPIVSISLPTVNQSQTASDGNVIFNYIYQNISLIVPDPEVANNVIVDFLNRIDQTADDAELILNAAKNDYKIASDWSPYLCQITYEPMRIDYGVLSLHGSYIAYRGAAHPETVYKSICYDLTSGKALQLTDILAENADYNTLYQKTIDALKPQANIKYLYEDYEATVKERFSNGATNESHWYLTENGLCFYFSPYEIAPYASGLITAEIPYNQLTGVLNDAYFPLEQEGAFGKIQSSAFDIKSAEQYTQFAEVVINQNSNKILLHTEHAAYHVKIESGSWNSSGTEFTPECTIFASYSLTPGDAIMLEADFGSGLPKYRLTYDSNNKTITNYISYNKDTGTVTLS